LKRALLDATDGDIVFKDATAPVGLVSAVAGEPHKKPGHTFLSLRALLAPQHPAMTSGALVMPVPSAASPELIQPPEIIPAPVAQPVPVAAPDSAFTARTAVSVMPSGSIGTGVIEKGMAKAWAIGLVGLGLFIGLNLAAGGYYSNRVYPGVRVDSLAVGGWTFDELHQKLLQEMPKPVLSAVVGTGHYQLALGNVGSGNTADLERNVREAGRSTPLPLAGVIGSWFAKPISPAFALSDDAVDRSVQLLAAAIERTPSNAAPMIHGTDVFVLADKPGVRLDRTAAAAAIRAAYGQVSTVSINPVRLDPSTVAADYTNDAAQAQAMITTNVQISLRKAHYSPTPAQIASWVVFLGPGKGITTDPAGVAVFVATIPGFFDRTGTVSGIVAALNARQVASLSPSTKKPTAGPTPVSLAAVGPAANYSYCLDETGGTAPSLAPATAATLGAGGSWTLGGKLRFVPAKTGCNFTIRLAGTAAMTALDPACEHQSTCRIHNDLALSVESWAKAPSSWLGDTNSYRTELINHIVGQWLGFGHPTCSVAATQAPVLSTPSLLVGGCSPKWYPVPAELQDTKVLPGF
jgi:hypothetical protein